MLQRNDFMIIVQTKSQKKLLQQFGNNGVCCDSTHGTTGYDFLLSTLLVVDEFGEGQPVAWCLSNHETEEFMKLFFSYVADASGPVTPKWFMSDMAPQFYEAFCTIFQCRPKWLWCTWHVDKSWRQELNRKIKDREIETTIYLQLRIVMEQQNVSLFDEYLNTLVKRLESSGTTKSFADYFKSQWLPHRQQWGHCFRMGDGINCNMFAEAFHKVFKYKYLGGKHNKRVDVALVNLIKFAKDKVFTRLIKLTKGKSSKRIALLHQRHSNSLRMSFANIEATDEDTVYSILSEDGNRKYLVTKVADYCEESLCMMKCSECGTCAHVMLCTCPDFLFNNIGCKHMHLLQRWLAPTNDQTNVLESPQAAAYVQNEIAKTIKSLERTDSNFPVMASRVKNRLHELIQQVEVCSSIDLEALSHFEKQLQAASNTFNSMLQYKTTSAIPVKNEIHANKNIAVQHTFFSTKKKRKRNDTIRFTKPTHEDFESFCDDEKWTMNDSQQNDKNPTALQYDTGMKLINFSFMLLTFIRSMEEACVLLLIDEEFPFHIFCYRVKANGYPPKK